MLNHEVGYRLGRFNCQSVVQFLCFDEVYSHEAAAGRENELDALGAQAQGGAAAFCHGISGWVASDRPNSNSRWIRGTQATLGELLRLRWFASRSFCSGVIIACHAFYYGVGMRF